MKYLIPFIIGLSILGYSYIYRFGLTQAEHKSLLVISAIIATMSLLIHLVTKDR